MEAHREALRWDPLSTWVMGITIVAHRKLRDFESAVRLLERAARIQPTAIRYTRILRHLDGRTGDLDSLRQWVDSMTRAVEPDSLAGARAVLAYYERDFERAWPGPGRTRDFELELRVCFLVSDRECLRAHGDTMLMNAQRDLAMLDANPLPIYPRARAQWIEARMGFAHALRGDRMAAIEWGTRATETLPASLDAMAGPEVVWRLARIHLMLGDRDAAIARLDEVLGLHHYLNVNYLKLDPLYDSLRGHPRFQALLTKYEN